MIRKIKKKLSLQLLRNLNRGKKISTCSSISIIMSLKETNFDTLQLVQDFF